MKIINSIAAIIAGALAAHGGSLPMGYTALDYIESTAKQYIDTGVNAATGLKVTADFAWGDKVNSNDDWGLVGAKNKDSGDAGIRILMVHIYNQKPYIGYGKGTRGNPSSSSEFARNERCKIVADFSDFSKLQVYQNGNKTLSVSDQAKYAANGSVDLKLNLYLFSYNQAGSATGMAKAKLYALKIERKNDVGGFDLLRDYLPAINPYGVVGLYDAVTRRFFASATSTPFVASKLPDSAKWPLHRLPSTKPYGQGAYIDTGVIAKDGTRMVAEMAWELEDNGNGELVFCGASTDASNGRFWLYGRTASTQRMGYLNRGKTIDGSKYPITTWKKYQVTTELDNALQSISCKVWDESAGVWKDNGNASESGYGPFSSELTLYLFADNCNGTAQSFCQSRCFYVKIYQKDSDEVYRLVRYFVPVITPGNTAAFFDLVEEKYYYNQGTQGFEKGSAVNYLPFETGASFSVK